MARTVILGAGVSGHTAAQHLTRALKGTDHEVVVISPNKQWNWIPSNIWVGTGSMEGKKVVFDLPPVYEKMGAKFHQAKATGIHPEGDGSRGPFVTYERVDAGHEGGVEGVGRDDARVAAQDEPEGVRGLRREAAGLQVRSPAELLGGRGQRAVLVDREEHPELVQRQHRDILCLSKERSSTSMSWRPSSLNHHHCVRSRWRFHVHRGVEQQ